MLKNLALIFVIRYFFFNLKFSKVNLIFSVFEHIVVFKACYRSMGTTGDPDRPVTEPDRMTLSLARAGTGEPLHRLEPVPVRVFTGSGSPVGRFSK
jgi:hypothetical protein